MGKKKKGSKIFIVRKRQEKQKIQINFVDGKKLIVVWFVTMTRDIWWEGGAIVGEKERRI